MAMKAKKKEAVNHPSHYGGEDNPYETIKVAENKLTQSEFRGAMLFQVMRYNDRSGKKDPSKMLEDFQKALWYQNRLVDYVMGKRFQVQKHQVRK
jgi:hypothetical protein